MGKHIKIITELRKNSKKEMFYVTFLFFVVKVNRK